MDDLELRRRVERANRAKDLVQSETFKTAMEEMTDDALNAWKDSAPDAPKAREDMYFICKALTGIADKLLEWVDDGIAAEQELEELQNGQ